MTLTVPTSSGTTAIVYHYNSTNKALYRGLFWNALTNYAVGDVVVSDGVGYRCVAAHTNQTPPSAPWTAAPPLLSNLVSFSFRYYDSSGSEYTTYTHYLLGIKQVALSFQTQLGTAAAGNRTRPYTVASSPIGDAKQVVPPLVPSSPFSSRGTVSLVALCFVAVLGIVLASYLGLCSRAMNLSNRSFQNSLSNQLAEFGLEEGLRAFNKNDWSGWTNDITVNWDTTTYGTTKRAIGTIIFPAGKLGQGVTATVKVRIDNYDAASLDANWDSGKTYRPNEVVGRNGVWYRCLFQNSGQTPTNNSPCWVQEQSSVHASWRESTSYVPGDMIYRGTTWYRCTSAHASPTVWTGANWDDIGPVLLYSMTEAHATGDILCVAGQWYYVTATGTPGLATPASSTNTSWKWSSSKSYLMGDFVYYVTGSTGRWYRCTAAHNNQTPSTGSSYWADAQGTSEMLTATTAFAWNSGSITYNRDDVVYYSSTGQWYRCVRAHSSTAGLIPTNTSYWSNAPRYSQAWNAGIEYRTNDIVSYDHDWYLSLSSTNNINQNPSSGSGHWISADTTNTTYQWNVTTAYAVGAIRCYGGVWYSCTMSNTGKSPNDSGYWKATWTNSAGVSTGAPVIYVESTVSSLGNPGNSSQLRAVIKPAPLFPNAAAAATNLTITASTGIVDSYDSSAGPYSAATAGYSAVLAAGTTLAINGPTNVRGYLAWPTPPSGITGSVKGPSSSPMPLIDPARISRSPSIPQFDILPTGGLTAIWANAAKGTSLPTGSTVSIGTPGATTPTVYNYNGTLTMGSGASVITTLNINGPVILYIKNNLNMIGGPTSVMNIRASGSAEIHIGGSLAVTSASDGIINYTTDPKKLILLCDTTSAAPQYYSEGVNPLYGVIYAPKITVTGGLYFNYNDTNTTTLHGAVSASNITYHNKAILHYDTSLRSASIRGVEQPYGVTDLRELFATERAPTP